MSLAPGNRKRGQFRFKKFLEKFAWDVKFPTLSRQKAAVQGRGTRRILLSVRTSVDTLEYGT